MAPTPRMLPPAKSKQARPSRWGAYTSPSVMSVSMLPRVIEHLGLGPWGQLARPALLQIEGVAPAQNVHRDTVNGDRLLFLLFGHGGICHRRAVKHIDS